MQICLAKVSPLLRLQAGRQLLLLIEHICLRFIKYIIKVIEKTARTNLNLIMRKNLLSILSIIISVICISIILKINYDISIAFKQADGKTKLLFGITELLRFGYKYYYLILSVISLILCLLAKRKNEIISIVLFAFILTCLSTVLIFLSLWKIMI